MNEFLLQKFINLVLAHTGIKVRHQDYRSFTQKLSIRMKALKISQGEKYYELLEKFSVQSENEWRELILLLTITESYFLRDMGQFNLLRTQVFPELIEEKRKQSKKLGVTKSLRVWSAGCSTGEEPYSLAILLQELIPDLSEWNLLILGTDINESVLEKAREGIYSDWSFRQVDPLLKSKYFSHLNSEWKIDHSIQQMVKFRPNNLIQDRYPNPYDEICNMDFIICRNVFVYFDFESIGKVIKKFHHTLRPGGYLMTGHAELYSQIMTEFSTRIFPESVIYQRHKINNPPISSENFSQSSQKSVIKAPRCNLSNPLFNRPSSPEESVMILSEQSPFNLGQNPSPFSSSPSSESKGESTPLFTPEKLSTSHPSSSLKSSVKLEENHQNFFIEIQNLVQTKSYQEAIEKTQRLLKMYPYHFEGHYLLAQIYANIGQHSQAIEHCRKAIELDSLSSLPYYLLAQIAEEQNQIEEAKSFLKRIIYLSSSAISAYYKLGEIYTRENDMKRAKKMYNTASGILKKMPPETLLEYPHNLTAGEMLNHLLQVSST